MSSRVRKIDTLQTVELAEGVEIRLRIAGPLSRGYAFVIDLVIRGLISGVIAIFVLWSGEMLGSVNVGFGFMLISWFLVSWFYHVYFEYGKKSATPGKRFMKLRVVQASGSPITFGQAIIRNFLRFADALPALAEAGTGGMTSYGIGLAACFLTTRFQRLGDLAANTLVVYNDAFIPISVTKSSQIEGKSPSVLLLRDEESAVLSFDDRAATWSQERRVELTDQLANLTGKTGNDGVIAVAKMAQWLRDNR